MRFVIFIFVCVLGFSCKDEPRDQIREGEAGYRSGEVIAPGAQILYGGEVGEGELSVDGTGLAGIVRGDDVFFYHAALGEVRLDDETSRRAIGYWMAGLDANGQPGNTTEQALTIVYPGLPDSVSSEVGVDLELPSANPDDRMTATNQARRWAAVVAPVDETEIATYLLPVSNTYSPNFIDHLVNDLQHESVTAFRMATTNVRRDIVAGDTVDVLGSVFRASPVIAANSTIGDSARAGILAHPDVFWNLLVLDAGTVTIDGLRNFADLSLPAACADFWINYNLSNGLRELVRVQLGGDVDAEATARQVAEENFKEYGNAFFECAVEKGAVALGGVPAIFTKVWFEFLGLAAMVNFIVEDVLLSSYYSATTYLAYETVEIARDLEIGDCVNAGGDLTVDETGSVDITCQSRYATAVSVDLSPLNGGAAFPLQAVAGDAFLWDGSTEVVPRDEGIFELTVTATDPLQREAHAYVAVAVGSDSCGNQVFDAEEECDLSAGEDQCPPGDICRACQCVADLCGNGVLDAGEMCEKTADFADLTCPGGQGCWHCQCYTPANLMDHPTTAQLADDFRHWYTTDFQPSDFQVWDTGANSMPLDDTWITYNESTGAFRYLYSDDLDDWTGWQGTAWLLDESLGCIAIGGIHQSYSGPPPSDLEFGLFLFTKPYYANPADNPCLFESVRDFVESAADAAAWP